MTLLWWSGRWWWLWYALLPDGDQSSGVVADAGEEARALER